MSDPSALLVVESWPQAAVALGVICAFAIWPGVLAWLNSRKASNNTADIQKKIHENNETTDVIKKTLTENNGGSHVKDQLDKIENAVEGLEDWKAAHMTWSADQMQMMADRFEEMDRIGRGNKELLEQVLEMVTIPPREE